MLEPRRLLTGTDPHAAWVFTDPAAAPTVRLSLNGHALASGGVNRWRGYNLSQAVTPGSLSGAGPGSLNYGVTYFHDYDDADNPSYEDAWHAMPLDGNYEFAIPADAFAPALDAGLFQQDFFLDADFNHDRAVDFDDFLIFAQHHTGTATSGTNSFATGDVNADGLVNFDDQLMVAQRYNTRLAPVPAYAGDVQVGSLAVQPDGTSPLVIGWAAMDDIAPSVDATGHALPGHAIEGYTVYRSAVNYTFNTVVGNVPRDGNATRYSLTDPTAVDGQKYYYRVRPYFTNADGGIEHAATGESDSAVAAMKAPTDLAAHALSSTSLSLTWADHSQRETSYRLYRVDRGGAMTLVQPLPANSTGATVTGLSVTSAYTFRVLAWNANIESMYAEATASPGFAATASNVTDGVTLAWAQPATLPGDGYRVTRTNPDGSTTTFDVSGTATSFIDTSPELTRGESYTYTLSTLDLSGAETPVGTATIGYAPRPVVSYTSTGLTITWPSGQTPPPTLEITVTGPSGQPTTTTVTLTPGAGGAGGTYFIPGLTPGTAYTVTYRDPSQGPGQTGSNASDKPLAVTTRVFHDDVVAYVMNKGGVNFSDPGDPAVTATVTPPPLDRYSNYDPKHDARSVKEGEPITVTVGNLPEHTYLKVYGTLGLDASSTDPSTGLPITGTTERADLIHPTLAAQGGGATMLTGAGYRYINGREWWSLGFGYAGDGWVEHTGSSATFTFASGGGLNGFAMAMEFLVVEVGTPTVTLTRSTTLVEDEKLPAGEQPRSILIARNKAVADKHELVVKIELASNPNDPSSASSKDAELLDHTVTIKADKDDAIVRIKDTDDKEAEGIENIYIILEANNRKTDLIQAGTIDDDTVVRKVTLRAKASGGAEGNFFNGFGFHVNATLEGEHLDKVFFSQGIKSKVVERDQTGGILTDAAVLAEIRARQPDVKDVVVNTPDDAPRVLPTPTNPIDNDPNQQAYEMAIDDGFAIKLIPGVTAKDAEFTFRYDNHAAGVPEIASNLPRPDPYVPDTYSRILEVTRKMKAFFFRAAPQGSSHEYDLIKAQPWDYTWSNIDLKMDAEDTRLPPNQRFVALKSKGKGKFDPHGIDDLMTLP